MAYINFAGLTKQHRVNQIGTDLGTSATLSIYTGTQPASPDIGATGTLLAQLTCGAGGFGTATMGVGPCSVTAAGSGFTNGTYTLGFSGGAGSGAAGTYTVSGGVVASIAITAPGSSYTSAPTLSFPSGGGSGATGQATLTGVLTANSITQANAAATGTAGYARLATSGGTGIVDLDVGTSSTSVIINTTAIVSGGPVAATSCIIYEA